jgi:ribose transport system ATP-binding protein
MEQYVLEMKGINKSFGSVPVLRNVEFKLRQGEVHALVGGNGAGKSTLMKIMTGVYTLDSGEIYVNGKLARIKDTRDAKAQGIAMIFQELSLVQSMTVAENIFLGDEIVHNGLRDIRGMNDRAAGILSDLDLDIDPTTPVYRLSVGLCQMVEIAKALSKDAKILVFDEPTASLSDAETSRLFEIIRTLKAKGVSMVYISHRMKEIKTIADSITILRDGQFILRDSVANLTMEQIISNLIGGDSSKHIFDWLPRNYNKNAPDLLRLESVKISDKIDNITFGLKPGEIIGLAGLMGSGRTEILETIFGLRKKIAGTIFLDGKKLDYSSPKEAILAGFALVPEDRRKLGLVLNHSLRENLILPILEKLCGDKLRFLIKEKRADAVAEESVHKFNIVTSSINKTIRLLSGGNQQKVVIAKWLNTNPQILMLDEPTAGVDIGAKSEILQIIRTFADQGNSVIFVSSELAELLAICDRIITIYNGRITGELSRKDIGGEEELQHAIQRG